MSAMKEKRKAKNQHRRKRTGLPLLSFEKKYRAKKAMAMNKIRKITLINGWPRMLFNSLKKFVERKLIG